MSNGDLISRKALIEELNKYIRTNRTEPVQLNALCADVCEVLRDNIVKVIPAVDVVDTEEYNELREAFVDFVCSGIHNPAPYCKNKCEGCIDNRGWCITERCIGFNPDGERRNNV